MKKNRKLLHVGCGQKTKIQTTDAFRSSEWEETRFDIDSRVKPDIVGSILKMDGIDGRSFDAVFSSHNIEHLYPHEVPVALAEFNRVLKDDGFVVITCPDLQSVSELIAEDKLTEAAYSSPAGPITPLDILYGHRASLQQGHHYMAHKCGFTLKVLMGTLKAAQFVKVAGLKRGHPFYDLWVIASKANIEEKQLHNLALSHFPGERKPQ
jgi:SAM-dependent methyltransferase